MSMKQILQDLKERWPLAVLVLVFIIGCFLIK